VAVGTLVVTKCCAYGKHAASNGIGSRARAKRTRESLILFGVPASLAVLCQHFLWPFLIGVGVSEENAYHFQALVVFVFLLIASFVVYVFEGNSLARDHHGLSLTDFEGVSGDSKWQEASEGLRARALEGIK